ncbi:hypothetical protein FISHEDRAFT_72019 [Fistulina hepatica ATCC 64428]|uniref:Uncharacterized protein n=1 Tax=Fistulina hepatica ATCC 64428 TaxID=1128425 RepID=A0A0D7AG28_9AGAR|nr:hypothetical protein FISHEDRAFT_72019 [Fistulina hepatica ATCC 64428]
MVACSDDLAKAYGLIDAAHQTAIHTAPPTGSLIIPAQRPSSSRVVRVVNISDEEEEPAGPLAPPDQGILAGRGTADVRTHTAQYMSTQAHHVRESAAGSSRRRSSSLPPPLLPPPYSLAPPGELVVVAAATQHPQQPVGMVDDPHRPVVTPRRVFAVQRDLSGPVRNIFVPFEVTPISPSLGKNTDCYLEAHHYSVDAINCIRCAWAAQPPRDVMLTRKGLFVQTLAEQGMLELEVCYLWFLLSSTPPSS